MQSAIENGRLVRDRKAISLKTPLSCVTLVDTDEQALSDLASVQDYIKDELNCLEVKTDNDEDKYIDYKCEPDNKEMGAALKKQYDKKLKTEISSLSSAQLRQYLKDGYIMIGDIKIEDGWLKVQKVFKDEFSNN
jgi:isoleucyl-tRNA synthetase